MKPLLKQKLKEQLQSTRKRARNKESRTLGPLLFIIYINDLPLAVQGCCVELYADDTLIYFASKSVSEIQAQLTSGLTNVLSWLHANFLILILK